MTFMSLCFSFFSSVLEAPTSTLNEQVMLQKQTFLSDIASEKTLDKVLEDMPEVVEAKETRVMHHRLQELVSATISADLLSDRLFQMESSLSTFQHAIEAYKTGQEQQSNGSVVWTALDSSVFDLDVERSHEHVQQYRDNLQIQNAKREEVLSHLHSLESFDPFRDPMYHTSRLVREQQVIMVDRLYDLCLQAEVLETKRRQEAEREIPRRIEPEIPTSRHDHSEREYDYYSTKSRDQYEYSTNRSRPALERRHSSGNRDLYETDRYDRYRVEEEMYEYNTNSTKRPKLRHSHSAGEQEFDRKRSNGRWESQYQHSSPRRYDHRPDTHWEHRDSGREGGRSYREDRERRW